MHRDVTLERVPSFFGQWQVYERRLADDGVNLASGSKSAPRSLLLRRPHRSVWRQSGPRNYLPYEKVALLTRPTPARRDAPFPQHRSRIAQRLNVEESFSDVGNTEGAYPFTRIHSRGERPTRNVVCTSSPLRSLRP